MLCRSQMMLNIFKIKNKIVIINQKQRKLKLNTDL